MPSPKNLLEFPSNCHFLSHRSGVFSVFGFRTHQARQPSLPIPPVSRSSTAFKSSASLPVRRFGAANGLPTQQAFTPLRSPVLEAKPLQPFNGIPAEPGGLLKLIRGAFLHWKMVKPEPDLTPSVTITAVDQNLRSPKPTGLVFSKTKGTCTRPWYEGISGRDHGRFQVKLGTIVIGELFTRQQALLVGQKLKVWLHNPFFQPDQLQPGLVNDVPVVKLGDRTLFNLDQALVPNQNCNSERLAMQWVNNLRIALAEKPLSLVAAQTKMYAVQETNKTITGLASWYGADFHGRETATGENYDQTEFTAAHRSLPFDTYLKVTNRHNGKVVIVRINDRGPYVANRALDLSLEAARSLDSENTGVVPIEAVVMQPNPTIDLPELAAADTLQIPETVVLKRNAERQDDMTVFIDN